MIKTNKILIAILLISSLLLGIGYAAIENITLDIVGTATAIPTTRTLLPGTEFNKKLKNSTNSSASNTNITKIVFDYWDNGYLEGETVIFSRYDWENGIPIDSDGLGGIKLFRSLDGTIAYILSEVQIYANANCADMFYHMEGVTEFCFNNFDTSKVKDMTKFFRRCDVLQTLDVSSLNTENVVTMEEMFGACSKLINISGLNVFKTTKVTNMINMFGNCENLSKVDLSSFETPNLQSMRGMFQYCYRIKEIDISSFDTSNVKDMCRVFYMCSNLEKMDVSNFDTSNVTNMEGMFGYLQVLPNIDVTHFNTSKVTTMERMFNNCRFKTIDLSSFDTANVKNMTKMFTNNPLLTTIYVSDKWTTAKVDHSNIIAEEEPFLDCTILKGGSGTSYSNEHVDISYGRIDGGPDSLSPGYLTLKK